MVEVEEKFGVVALLDALGIQSATIEESRAFIEFLEKCKHMTSAFLAGFLNSYLYEAEENYDKEEALKKIIENSPQMRTFGDTLLITWEIKNEKYISAYLRGIAAVVSWLIKDGLENRILFRGAVSIGSYLESDTTIIGPVVADVASWYEKSDWIGCMTTPYCTRYAKSRFGEKSNILNFVKYNVPLKKGDTIDAFCANWPLQVNISDKKEWVDPMSFYYEAVAKLNIPFGTERKYSNSESFLKHCIQNNLHFAE